MDYYSTDKIIEWAKINKGALAPNDRQEWVKLCWCLQYLHYPASTFAAISRTDTTETECNRVWQREQKKYRTYIKNSDEAVSAIVGMAKAATRAARLSMAMFRADGRCDYTQPVAPVAPVAPSAPRQIRYIYDTSLARMETNVSKSNLFIFLCSIFPEDDVMRVLKLYRVGAIKTENGYNGYSAAYPLINADGKIVDVRIIPYSEDGHRVKGIKYEASFYMAMCHLSNMRAAWPLFGEHLRDEHKAVCLVESEKTALICSIVRPDYIWMATTGLPNLTADRLQGIKGMKIYVYPDKDGINQWQHKVDELQADGFNILLCRDYILQHAKGDKDDLGDIILRQKKMEQQRDEQPDEQQPEQEPAAPIQTTQPQKVAWMNLLKRCPPLQRLSDGLQLQVVLG